MNTATEAKTPVPSPPDSGVFTVISCKRVGPHLVERCLKTGGLPPLLFALLLGEHVLAVSSGLRPVP